MSATPFMQLYVADYIGDTLHLTTEQHGAYLLLLMAMWRAGGALPNDDQKLSRIVGLSPARWRRISADVMAFFDVLDDQITQKRLVEEIKKAKEKSAKRADAGAKGGAAKALKNNETAVANATVLPKHSSEPESDKKERNPPPPRGGSTPKPNLNPMNWPSNAFERIWRGYPNRVGKPAAEKAFEKARREAKEPFEIVIAGLEAYVSKTDDRPWCNPSTWLNQKRWNDQPARGPPRRSGGGRGNAMLDYALELHMRDHDDRDRSANPPGHSEIIPPDRSASGRGGFDRSADFADPAYAGREGRDRFDGGPD